MTTSPEDLRNAIAYVERFCRDYPDQKPHLNIVLDAARKFASAEARIKQLEDAHDRLIFNHCMRRDSQ